MDFINGIEVEIKKNELDNKFYKIVDKVDNKIKDEIFVISFGV